MERMEIHKQVREILDRTVANGAYSAEDFIFLQNLYFRGMSDKQAEIAGVLGIPQSLDDLT